MNDLDYFQGIWDIEPTAKGIRSVISITPRQMAAARALAGLTQQQLADMSGVSLATIKRIEGSNAVNNNFEGLRVSTLSKLILTFEEMGIEFSADKERYTIALMRKA